MVGDNNSILGKLKETAGQTVADADKASVRQIMIDKAVLKFSAALRSDPSASNQATQDKITKGLELQGLSQAEKVAVAQRALDMIEGKSKPTLTGGFNSQASVTAAPPKKDHVAALGELANRMENTHVGDAERREQARQSARAFIEGKEAEVKGVISRQTPEIQAQAKKIMSGIDNPNVNSAVDGIVHEVIEKAKADIKSGKIQPVPGQNIDLSNINPTPADIEVVKAKAKELIAERLGHATSPAQIQSTLNNIDMGKIYREAANKSLGRFEDWFGKIPTADEALGQAAQGVRGFAQSVQKLYDDRDAEIARIRDMKANDPEAYKNYCNSPAGHVPFAAGECIDAFKAPKR